MATISEALALAVQHHQAGRLQLAEQIYRQHPRRRAESSGCTGICLAWLVPSLESLRPEWNASVVAWRFNPTGLRHAATWAMCCGIKESWTRRSPVTVGRSNSSRILPRHATIWAVALRDQGKLDDAAVCYRRAVELKPDYAQAHHNLGVVFKGLGGQTRGRVLSPCVGTEA